GAQTFSATLRTAGPETLIVQDTADLSVSGAASVTLVPAAPASFAVSGLPAASLAGTNASVTVVAQDQFGNTIPTYSGILHFSSTDSQAILPPDSVYTPDNGTHGFPVTLNTGGNQTLMVTDTGTGLTGAQTIQVSNPLPVLTTLSPTSATANGAPITLTVTGSNFVATSVVRWDDNPLVSTFIIR